MTEENKELKSGPQPDKESKVFSWILFAELGMEFAVVIAAPLIIFIFLENILSFVGLAEAAAWVDKKNATSNTYRITGILAAVFISFYAIISKIRKIEKLIRNK